MGLGSFGVYSWGMANKDDIADGIGLAFWRFMGWVVTIFLCVVGTFIGCVWAVNKFDL